MNIIKQSKFLKGLNDRESLKRLKENYLRNLNYAKKIQMALLPQTPPETEQYNFEFYYSPAEIIGGDIYDIKFYRDQYVIFYLADVAGHGVPAAMLTVFAKQSLETTTKILNKEILNSPMQALKKLNEKLVDANFEGNPQVTIFYCIYSIEDKTLTYSSAGHHPAVLLRETEEKLIFFGKPSVPLGWFKDIKIYEDNIQLQSGDKIIIFTDGLFENLPVKGDEYDFICNVLLKNKDLSLNKIIKKLITERNKVSPDYQDDDIAILGFNVK